jgi:hypothetical protein
VLINEFFLLVATQRHHPSKYNSIRDAGGELVVIQARLVSCWAGLLDVTVQTNHVVLR